MWSLSFLLFTTFHANYLGLNPETKINESISIGYTTLFFLETMQPRESRMNTD